VSQDHRVRGSARAQARGSYDDGSLEEFGYYTEYMAGDLLLLLTDPAGGQTLVTCQGQQSVEEVPVAACVLAGRSPKCAQPG
jgi:hypothetical protein